jgi:hypothetical protein
LFFGGSKLKKKGRPKKHTKAKDRIKMICLNEKASVLLERIQNMRPNFNFSRYVSERIIDDFGDLEGIIKVLKREIGNNNKEIDAMQEENKKLVFKIKELQDEEIVRGVL